MNVEILGWIATLILLFGYYSNANKSIWSWVIWFHGNALMLIYALAIESYSVAFLSIVLMALNVYGYLSWKKSSH